MEEDGAASVRVDKRKSTLPGIRKLVSSVNSEELKLSISGIFDRLGGGVLENKGLPGVVQPFPLHSAKTVTWWGRKWG